MDVSLTHVNMQAQITFLRTANFNALLVKLDKLMQEIYLFAVCYFREYILYYCSLQNIFGGTSFYIFNVKVQSENDHKHDRIIFRKTLKTYWLFVRRYEIQSVGYYSLIGIQSLLGIMYFETNVREWAL